MKTRLSALVLAIALLCGFAANKLFAQRASGPIVELPSGQAEGVSVAGVESFLGLPFARAPIGDLRWHLPEAPAAWAGIRSATVSHGGCAAPESGDGPASHDEDCLYLNVYRPAGTKAGDRLPVMLFLHGGGNMWGSPGIYDGMRMARAAHAVVVIPAYRLGVFGFLSLPGSIAGDTALQDQIAALRWVQHSAISLGGSPALVTLAGESAGAADVCTLLASPAAKGLFSAAIMQSGFCTGTPDRGTANTIGRAVAAAVGCPDSAPSCLRALPTDRLMEAWNKVWNGGSVHTPLFPTTPSGTPLLPRAPDDAFRANLQVKVPVLIGFDRDELRSFLWHEFPLTADRFSTILQHAYGLNVRAVAAEYPLTSGSDPLYTLGAIRSDETIICPSLATAEILARHGPVSTYEFADRTAPPFRGLAERHPVPPGFDAGASHTSELQYLFGYQAVAHDLSADQAGLADTMSRLWVAFGRTPSASQWQSFRTDRRQTTVFTLAAPSGTSLRDDVSEQHHCGFWAAHPIVVTSLLP